MTHDLFEPADSVAQAAGPRDADWEAFPGDELDGRRPRVRCAACRAADERRADSGDRAPAGARRLCFGCYRAALDRRRQIGEVLSRVVNPFEGAREAPLSEVRGVVRHFRVPPSPADRDPRYAAFAKRRLQAQRAARRALELDEPFVDLEQFPVSWRPFVRIAMNA